MPAASPGGGCALACHAIHANFLAYKPLVHSMQARDPGGRDCAAHVRAARREARACVDAGHRTNEAACRAVVWSHPAGQHVLERIVEPCCQQAQRLE